MAQVLSQRRDTRTILLAEDDPDDQMFAIRALRSLSTTQQIRTVSDGEELLDYLNREGKYSDPRLSPRPALILLDLNMPRMDGREALRTIKRTPHLRTIPVVVLTTSESETDIYNTYEDGANAYVTKPSTFKDVQRALSKLGDFWLQVARLPVGTSENK